MEPTAIPSTSATPISHAHDSLSKPASIPEKILSAVQHVFRRDIALVIVVFLLALVVRWQLLRYELFFEFDSYWHARMISYLLQGQGILNVDPLAYYSNAAAASLPGIPYLFWIASAIIYKLFTLNAPYDFERWVFFVKLIPALFGALTCVAMYFLGKELLKGPHEKAAGFFAGLFAAIVPSFVYRTMGGFLEDDSMGFLWMIIGFVFFVRALRNPEWKREHIMNALLAGLSFAAMAFTWGAFYILIPILLGTGFLQLVYWIKGNHPIKARHYAQLWLIMFVILAVAGTLQTGTVWLGSFGTILGNLLFKAELQWWAVLLFIVALGAVIVILARVRTSLGNGEKVLHGIYALILLLLILSPLIIFVFNISLRSGDVLGQTVGEESEGRNYFGNKYSMLIVFALIGIPLLGYLLYRHADRFQVLFLQAIWLIMTFFMAWGKLKFTFYWGLPLAMMGAIVCISAWAWAERRSIKTKKIIAFGIAFMALCGVAAGTLFVTQNIPNIETSAGWKEALFWSEKNLPANTVFMNWWDEGHWISFLSGKKVIIDNRNADPKATSAVAQFILAKDESEAISITDKYHSTHVIFGDDLLEKMANLTFFAYNITNGNDPRVQGLFGSILNCSKKTTALTHEESYQCGSNNFSTAQMTAFPTVWQEQPNQLQDGAPLYIYRTEDFAKIYVFSQEENKRMLARMWMHDPTITHYKEVYRNYGGVRIFEVVNPTPLSG